MYVLDKSKFSQNEIDQHRERLTMQAKVSFGVPPPPFPAWVETETEFCVPRFYGFDAFGPPMHDERVEGTPIGLTFEGTLTDIQQRATDAAFGKHLSEGGNGGVMISLPCGFGKTVWAVHAVCRLGRKACVVVHKGVIRDQWVASFERFCPGVRVGCIQGNKKWKTDDCDVVVAMVLTLAKGEEGSAPPCLQEFGTVVVDECHHMAAPVMHRAMRAFRAKHIIGLTATKDRPDKLTPLLHYSLGPEGFHAERNAGEKVKVSMALFPNGAKEVLSRDKKPLYSIMVNHLAVNPARNRFLAERISVMHKNGRVLLVLSHRRNQLVQLKKILLSLGVPEEQIGHFVGSTPDSDRAAELAKRIVLCTYDMADEGIDKREADVCVMATPKGRVTQCIGRIQRPCETKQPPLVLDVADDCSSIFSSMRWKRQSVYRKEGYEVQTLSYDAPHGEWFS